MEQLAVDPLESICMDGPNKSTYVSSLLSNAKKEQIQQVLLHNMDVFAWTHLDMAGINPYMPLIKLMPSLQPGRLDRK